MPACQLWRTLPHDVRQLPARYSRECSNRPPDRGEYATIGQLDVNCADAENGCNFPHIQRRRRAARHNRHFHARSDL